MPRFVVTGGEGFVGAHLVRLLADCGDEILSIDAGEDYERTEPAMGNDLRAWRRASLLRGVDTLRADVRDRDLVAAALRALRPTHVVHLGNLPLADLAEARPEDARGSIVEGSLCMLDAVAEARPSTRYVYVSSSMVYGHFTTEPMPEGGSKRPVNLYGRLKLEAERALASRASRLAVPLTIVRPSAVYGPGDVNGRVLQRMVEAAAGGEAFRLRCSPDLRLDFTHVEDLAHGLRAAALSPAGADRIYNLTAGGARSLGEAIALIRKRRWDLRVEAAPPVLPRPLRGTLDVRRAQEDFHWEPRSLEEGLPAYLDFTERRLFAPNANAA